MTRNETRRGMYLDLDWMQAPFRCRRTFDIELPLFAFALFAHCCRILKPTLYVLVDCKWEKLKKFSVKRVRAIYRRKYRDNCHLFGCMYMETNVDLYILIEQAVNVMRLVSPACSC